MLWHFNAGKTFFPQLKIKNKDKKKSVSRLLYTDPLNAQSCPICDEIVWPCRGCVFDHACLGKCKTPNICKLTFVQREYVIIAKVIFCGCMIVI